MFFLAYKTMFFRLLMIIIIDSRSCNCYLRVVLTNQFESLKPGRLDFQDCLTKENASQITVLV